MQSSAEQRGLRLSGGANDLPDHAIPVMLPLLPGGITKARFSTSLQYHDLAKEWSILRKSSVGECASMPRDAGVFFMCKAVHT